MGDILSQVCLVEMQYRKVREMIAEPDGLPNSGPFKAERLAALKKRLEAASMEVTAVIVELASCYSSSNKLSHGIFSSSFIDVLPDPERICIFLFLSPFTFSSRTGYPQDNCFDWDRLIVLTFPS